MRLNKLQALQNSQIDAICGNFIKHGEAFYHPTTRKLSFIQNGVCIKSDCSFRDHHDGEARKILLPKHMRTHFKTIVGGDCCLPLEKIGQVVACLAHFFVDHQKSYLQNGVLPQEASRLMTHIDMYHKEGDAIKDPPIYPIRETKLANGVVKKWFGLRIHGPALTNADWVN